MNQRKSNSSFQARLFKQDNRIGESFFVGVILLSLIIIFFNDILLFNKTLKSSYALAHAFRNGPIEAQVKWERSSYMDVTPAVLEEPYLEFKKNTFSKGIFPLWNPHQACGMPFFANGQPAVLFPLTLLQYFIPEKYSWDFFIILEIFLAGLFTFIFMRLLNYPVVPSVFSAIAYMFSGPLITWMVNVVTNTSVLLPLLFICVEKIIRSRRIKWVIIGSIVVSLVIFSGHPERPVFTFLTTFIYFTLRLVLMKNNLRDKLKILKLISSAFVLGLLLSAIFILPFAEYLIHGWTTHHEKIGLMSEEQISRAVTILIPYFFQNTIMSSAWQRAGWYGGYLGIMIVLFALIGMFKKDKDKNNIIFGFIAWFIILKCYGIWVINWIGHLPVFNILRYSIHYTQDFAFAMAILSGIGLYKLIESKKRLKDIMIPAVFITIVIIAYLFYYGAKPHMVRASMFALGILFFAVLSGYVINYRKIFSSFLVLLLVIELFYLMPKEHVKKYNAFSKVPYIEFIKAKKPLMRSFGVEGVLYPNVATGFGIDDLGVYEGLAPKRFVVYAKEFLDPKSFGKNMCALRRLLPTYNSPFLDLLNVGYIIQGRDLNLNMGAANTEMIYSQEVKIFKRKTVFPRAFVVHNILFAKDESDVIRLMKENANNLSNTVVIEGAKDIVERNRFRAATATGASAVDIVEYQVNHVKLRTFLKQPGALVLADTYYPGWEVLVDGKKNKIYAADLLLRAVPLDQGNHTVDFYFKPMSFILGAWISIVTLAIIVICAIRMRIRKLISLRTK